MISRIDRFVFAVFSSTTPSKSSNLKVGGTSFCFLINFRICVTSAKTKNSLYCLGLLCPWNLTIIMVNNELMKMIIPNANETTFDSQTERTEQNSIMTVNVLDRSLN